MIIYGNVLYRGHAVVCFFFKFTPIPAEIHNVPKEVSLQKSRYKIARNMGPNILSRVENFKNYL